MIALQKTDITNGSDLIRQWPWEYSAGILRTPDGLRLMPTGLGIVNKRQGGKLEPNPPIIFESRLQASGDFSVAVKTMGDTPVELNLYGQLPYIFDDFRFERSRIACGIDDDTLVVRIWDGSSQKPVRHVFALPSLHSNGFRLEVRRAGNSVVFLVDGMRVGTTEVGDAVFARKQDGESGEAEVWLGLNSEHGEALIAELTAQGLHGGRLYSVDISSLHVCDMQPAGLQRQVRQPGFLIGAAVSHYPLASDTRYAEVCLGGELGSITTENELKPQRIQPLEGVFDFGPADFLVGLAKRHGIAVHGHTLVYSKATPRWMQELPCKTEADKQRIKDAYIKHITTVVRHFKGRIASWDVLNEVIDGFHNNVKLEENIWHQAMGGLGAEDGGYVAVALRAAHAADPDAQLFINDYGMETNPQSRGAAMLNLARRMRELGVPLHGIGIQGHVYEIPRDTIYSDKLRKLMDDFGELGLKVRVTELDVTGSASPDKAEAAALQTRQYADVLQVCLEAPNCDGLTFWGLFDETGSTVALEGGRLVFGDALLFGVGGVAKGLRVKLKRVL